MRLLSVVALALVQLACSGAVAPEPMSVDRQATVVPNTYTCSTVTYYLGRDFGANAFAVNPVPAAPVNETYQPVDANGDSITLTSPDGIVFAWTSTALIRAVFIRADVPGSELGSVTNQLWLYANPGGGGAYSGGGIYTENSANQRFPAKYIEFCFDAPPPPPEYELAISKTAHMSYRRTFEWSLSKTASVAELTLSPAQVFPVSYVVEAAAGEPVLSDFVAFGRILISNPAPIAASLVSVADAVTGGPDAAVDCGVAFPYELAAGAQLECTWTSDVPSPIDYADTATVTTTGNVHGGVASAIAVFAEAAVTDVDACATVTDDPAGPLGNVCADAGPVTFSYTVDAGPFAACGSYELTNVASLVTSDTGATRSASVVIPIAIPCEGGCTLTPGYWKTHSKYGPSAFDATWALVGEDTPFFLSGLTWFSQFGVSPAGNAYFQLSHQYAAAVLSDLAGASTGAVDAALAEARGLLETYTPAQVGAMKGGSPVRARFVSLGSTLGAFNLGAIGPGHCSL